LGQVRTRKKERRGHEVKEEDIKRNKANDIKKRTWKDKKGEKEREGCKKTKRMECLMQRE